MQDEKWTDIIILFWLKTLQSPQINSKISALLLRNWSQKCFLTEFISALTANSIIPLIIILMNYCMFWNYSNCGNFVKRGWRSFALSDRQLKVLYCHSVVILGNQRKYQKVCDKILDSSDQLNLEWSKSSWKKELTKLTVTAAYEFSLCTSNAV